MMNFTTYTHVEKCIWVSSLHTRHSALDAESHQIIKNASTKPNGFFGSIFGLCHASKIIFLMLVKVSNPKNCFPHVCESVSNASESLSHYCENVSEAFLLRITQWKYKKCGFYYESRKTTLFTSLRTSMQLSI